VWAERDPAKLPWADVGAQIVIESTGHFTDGNKAKAHLGATVKKVIISGIMTTIHSYTNDQVILDTPHKDLRRARAAALSMIPTSTGAAKALKLVIPETAGKLDGFAIRVPTPNVSLVDLTYIAEKPTSAEALNAAFKKASEGELKGILGVDSNLLVSSDFKGDARSSIVDTPLTKVVGNLVKVLSWYDNEWGYSSRVVDLISFLFAKGL
jgi:glyceraldehyde 3-phosphate dehydrogenase